MSLSDRLLDLDPRVFENLAYDLVVSAGLQNAVWRTPGPDEGRDIEGHVPRLDFSGEVTRESWFVECKRYTQAIDWATVWSKLAFADSHGADFLLMITTSHLSPQCKSEVGRWNERGQTPQVRYWDGSKLETVLQQHPAILTKYGLAEEQRIRVAAFLDLATTVARLTQAAYGGTESREAPGAALEAATAGSELMLNRIAQIESFGAARHRPFRVDQDMYQWLEYEGAPEHLAQFDRFGLRAVAAFIRHVTGATAMTLTPSDTAVVLALPRILPDAAGDTTRLLGLWGGFGAELGDSQVVLYPSELS